LDDDLPRKAKARDFIDLVRREAIKFFIGVAVQDFLQLHGDPSCVRPPSAAAVTHALVHIALKALRKASNAILDGQRG
jgi:hypothetical protein